MAAGFNFELMWKFIHRLIKNNEKVEISYLRGFGHGNF